MSTGYVVDERDIFFTLFEHLHTERLAEIPRHQGFGRDDAKMIFDEAMRLAKEDLYPARAPGDREGCRFADGEVRVPKGYKDLYAQYAAGGWLALNASEDLGGASVPTPVAVACGEVLVGANPAFAIYGGLSRGVGRVIDRFGTPWQRQHVAKRLFSGDWLGTMCLTEPQAGTAVGDCRTTAVRQGEGPGDKVYHLKGTKMFISGGENDIGDNIVHLVLARTPDAPAGIKGLSLFLVPKRRIAADGAPGARNGVRCAGIEEKMGLHASATCVLNFGEDAETEGWILGEEGGGIQIMFHLMNEARIGTGLQGLGAGAAAYQLALQYAHERVQGVRLEDLRDAHAPRVTILEHPDVRRMLFTMRAQIEGMRALLYQTAYYAEVARHHPDEATRNEHQQLLELHTPIVKAHCSDVGFDVTVMALQTFGGAGYIREQGVEQLLRDTKVSSIYEGTNGVQALDLVGRKLARNNGESFTLLMGRIDRCVQAHLEHPVLRPLAERLRAEQDRCREAVGQMARAGLSGDVNYPALVATSFLTLLANTCIARLFLEQASAAHDALSALCLEAGARTPEARDALIARSSEAAFYDTKLRTVRFFFTSLLPENLGLAAAIADADRGILTARI